MYNPAHDLGWEKDWFTLSVARTQNASSRGNYEYDFSSQRRIK